MAHDDFKRHVERWLRTTVVGVKSLAITFFLPARHLRARLYFQGALNTWNDPALFERFQPTEAVAQKMIHDAFSPRLLRRYKWGFRKNAQLPCFVFLTQKKRWTKGRALISYFQSFQATLLKAASRALDSICKQTWPQDFGQLSIPQIWKKVHHHFEATDDSISLACVNDDLVVFFNSVPQTRLLDAVHQLLDQ